MIKVLGLPLYGPIAASNRVRLGQYQKGLQDLGIHLNMQPLLGDSYLAYRFNGSRLPVGDLVLRGLNRVKVLIKSNHFDLAIVHCELLPLMPSWLETLFLNLPYIYDFDDAFYSRYQIGRLKFLRPLLGSKIDKFIERAAAVTAGSGYLANYARLLNKNTIILPSVVDLKRYVGTEKSKKSIFTIGWLGSPSTAYYLKQLVEPLEQLAALGPVRFVVVGGSAPAIANVEVLEVPWSLETEVELIKSFDVGVMPLPDDEWSRGKCAFKLIQYMACGLPVVASKIGANVELVTPDCGFLVQDSAGWLESFKLLRDRIALRQRMGAAGRKRVELHYSLDKNLPTMASVIRNVVEQ